MIAHEPPLLADAPMPQYTEGAPVAVADKPDKAAVAVPVVVACAAMVVVALPLPIENVWPEG